MEKKRILVVDDNDLFRESIVETLRRLGCEIESARDGYEAIELFSASCFDLVVSDMKMPGMSGIELLEKVKQINPEVPFLIITAYGAIETAVEAMKKGAFDFIQKTDNLIDELELTVSRTLQYQSLLQENRRLKSELRGQWNFIGDGSCMEEIRTLIASVAESRSTVLVTGESGTGKELIARSIHYQSRRSNGPFVKVNCAALPEGLIESELFGHEKGAFTGAIKHKKGKFEAASGGTLLLDEIGEMPMVAQAKLLRVLQEREINKVGGDDPIEVDVRVVATTNRDLEEAVSKGEFREDLYYRLNVIHIHLPPLRERKDDISKLAEHFIKKFNDENGFSVEGLTDDSLRVLCSHNWPGNIRELENAIERAVVLTRTGQIKPEIFQFRSPLQHSPGNAQMVQAGMTVAEMEKKLILETLEHCNQNRTKAAEMLGISIRTLLNKLNEYNME
ncbi:MAG TPA: sigma-54 dependent transcriptional regulator [Chitinispirillaceae bacterium]|nr:sigma-54 dependent transcriptional regulator [Chitinispirillaceae bacterium]